MNTPSYPLAAMAPATQEDDGFNVREYVDILLDNKWLIGTVTALAIAIGVAYALSAKPVYQANILIQVEDSAGSAQSFLGEASSLFDVKTPATGEIEIIRSRMIISQAVENTRLFIDAQPRYVPLIGNWLARRATTLSEPGFMGLSGYVSGTESIDVAQFDVGAQMESVDFTLTAGDNGAYALVADHMGEPLQGQVGQLLEYTGPHGPVRLMVADLQAKPGAQFKLARTSRLGAIESLQERLQLAERGRQSGVIAATLQDNDPVKLATILNEIGRQYVRQNIERKAAEAQKTLSFLDMQLPQYKRQLEQSEDVYNRYRNQKGTVAFDEEAKLILGQTVDLQTKLMDAQQRRRELEPRFTGKHPAIQTLDAQIAAWTRELNAINGRIRNMPETQQDALRMERDVKVNSELYQSLVNNALQLRLVKEGKIGNVRLLDEAQLAEIPVKPQKGLVIALAAVLGLFAGIGLALLRNAFFRGIRSPQEIEISTGLNVYATIPLSTAQASLLKRTATSPVIAGSAQTQLLIAAAPHDPAAESLRSLRTALQFAMLESVNNRVIFTGATPGVGKSFLSSNFAGIMANAGKRVLLVDADLRKGTVHEYVGLGRARGMSELIAGQITLNQATHREVLPNLDVITTGVLPPNPAELLMSESCTRLLSVFSDTYDLVIIDTPPVLVAADTAALATHVGTILFVARADKTQMGEVLESAKRLSHGGGAITGVIFNAMDMSRRHYGTYNYRYGGYRYQQYSYGDAASTSTSLKSRA